MPNHCLQSPSRLLAAGLAAAALAAQEPNVLPLDKSYHVGLLEVEVENPSGTLSHRGAIGRIALTPNGQFDGLLDSYETDVATGTIIVPNDPFDGLYAVRGDGVCLLDLEPLTPGIDIAPAWIRPDGGVIHTVSSRLEDKATSFIAIEVGSGLSNATVSGTYRLVSQRVEFDPSGTSGWRVEHEFGTAQFDGAGAGTFAITKIEATSAGSTSSPQSGSFAYAVAGDGTLTFANGTGACSADGELLFLMTTEADGEVGLLVGVRTGSSYSLQDLAGRYGFTGHRYQLGPNPATEPNTQVLLGELSLSASSPAAGSWALNGTVLEATPSSKTVANQTSSGAATLGGAGLPASELTLSEPARTWSMWTSATGHFLVGREPGPHPHQLFASRQCPASVPVGSSTAGSGGETPLLGMRTYPRLGNASFSFAVEGGVGGAICAIPIATAPGPGLPAFGGTIWIDTAAIGTTAVTVLDGAPGVAGEGSGLAALPIPNNLALIGFELWAQALVFDSAASSGVALTNAYQAVICR